MNKKILTFLLFAAILLSGCALEQQLATESAATSTETIIITESPTQIGTVPITEHPIQATPLLDIAPGSHLRRFTCDDTGDYLDYYLFVPENAVAGMPLIIFLHGDGEVGNTDVLSDFGPIHSAREIYGENFPFILISPCTRTPSWTDGSISATLMALIRAVSEECSIDSEHMIITGHSRGAIGVWYLISEYGDVFSAAVPVSCGADRPLNTENLAKVPVYALAGDMGEYEIYYGNEMQKLVTQIQELGGNAQFTQLEGCDHINTDTAAYTQEIFEWMVEQ